MALRRKSRQIAMQALYQYAIRRDEVDHILTFDWVPEQARSQMTEFARELVQGALANLQDLDDLINRYLEHWRPDRVGEVERAILRVAAFELVHCPDIPHHATIDEAVHLAKRFCDEKSFRFINGVLDGISTGIQKKDPTNTQSSGGPGETV